MAADPLPGMKAVSAQIGRSHVRAEPGQSMPRLDTPSIGQGLTENPSRVEKKRLYGRTAGATGTVPQMLPHAGLGQRAWEAISPRDCRYPTRDSALAEW